MLTSASRDRRRSVPWHAVATALAGTLVVAACGASPASILPGSASAPSTPALAATTAPPSSAPMSASPSPSGSGYIAGLSASAVTSALRPLGLTCGAPESGGLSGSQPTEQAWSCVGSAAGGVTLIASMQGPDDSHIEVAAFEVQQEKAFPLAVIESYFEAMASVVGGAVGPQVDDWLVAHLPSLQKEGLVDTTISGNDYELSYGGSIASNATSFTIGSAAGPPESPSPGALPSGSGAGYFGQVEGVPGGWVAFTDTRASFTVAFPANPVAQAPLPTAAPSGPTLRSLYQWTSADRSISYAVTTWDEPPGSLVADPQTALNDVLGSYVSRFGGDLVAKDATSVGGHPGLDAVMTNSRGWVCFRFIAEGDRLYVLGGTNGNGCPADMAAFVGSFRSSSP